MSILIVDDEIDRLEPHINRLKADGYSILTVDEFTETGIRRILEEYKEEIDAIILDIMIAFEEEEFNKDETDFGRRTGVVILNIIREYIPEVPVIVFSVVRSKDLPPMIQSSNVSAFIKKPCLPSRLSEEIRKVI